jgi:hypothetical protein
MKSNVVDNSSRLIDGLHEGSNSSLFLSLCEQHRVNLPTNSVGTQKIARISIRYAEDHEDK